MARPRKQPAEQRSVRMPCPRVTPAELAHVEAQALAAGLATADFVRRLVLGIRVAPRRSRIENAAIVELIRVGNNLNQMARATNSGHPPASADLRAALGVLRGVLERLHQSDCGGEPQADTIDASRDAGSPAGVCGDAGGAADGP